MVSKPETEIQSSTVAVVDYLKRDSSFEQSAPEYETEVHNSKKARVAETADARTGASKNNTRNEKLNVTFSSSNDVFEITRRTDEEKNDMHMSKEDQRFIIRGIVNDIRRFDCDEQLIEERGLERLVEQQASERIERVKSAICVILQRQRQSKLFYTTKKQIQIINEGWLEKHYRPFSKVSANLARTRGLRDQERAPSFYPRKIIMSR